MKKLLFGSIVLVAAVSASTSSWALASQPGDITIAFTDVGYYEVRAYTREGNDAGPLLTDFPPSSFDVVTGIAIDRTRRVLVNTRDDGLVAIDSESGSASMIGPTFEGWLEPNVDGRVIGRSSTRIASFDPITNAFSTRFDPSTSAVLDGATLRGADSLADGTILLASDDTLFRLAPGASEVTVLSTGGLFTSMADAPGFSWAIGDLVTTRDGRILVASTGQTCAGCIFDAARLVEIDPDTGAQTLVHAGVQAEFPGIGGMFSMAVDPFGVVYISRDGATTSDGAEMSRIGTSGSVDDFPLTGGTQRTGGLAIHPIPEPTTALLLGLGLAAMVHRPSKR